MTNVFEKRCALLKKSKKLRNILKKCYSFIKKQKIKNVFKKRYGPSKKKIKTEKFLQKALRSF